MNGIKENKGWAVIYDGLMKLFIAISYEELSFEELGYKESFVKEHLSKAKAMSLANELNKIVDKQIY